MRISPVTRIVTAAALVLTLWSAPIAEARNVTPGARESIERFVWNIGRLLGRYLAPIAYGLPSVPIPDEEEGTTASGLPSVPIPEE